MPPNSETGRKKRQLKTRIDKVDQDTAHNFLVERENLFAASTLEQLFFLSACFSGRFVSNDSRPVISVLCVELIRLIASITISSFIVVSIVEGILIWPM
jgi:hypothetical protein